MHGARAFTIGRGDWPLRGLRGARRRAGARLRQSLPARGPPAGSDAATLSHRRRHAASCAPRTARCLRRRPASAWPGRVRGRITHARAAQDREWLRMLADSVDVGRAAAQPSARTTRTGRCRRGSWRGVAVIAQESEPAPRPSSSETSTSTEPLQSSGASASSSAPSFHCASQSSMSISSTVPSKYWSSIVPSSSSKATTSNSDPPFQRYQSPMPGCGVAMVALSCRHSI